MKIGLFIAIAAIQSGLLCAQDLQMKALEESLAIAKQEAKLEVLAKHADRLTKRKVECERSGDTAAAAELQKRISTLESEIQQALVALESTATEAQEKLDTLFESYQNEQTAKTAESQEKPTSTPNNANAARRKVPTVVDVGGLGRGFSFNPRFAEWTRGDAALASQDKKLLEGTKLTWKCSEPLLAGSYTVFMNSRNSSKTALGKASLAVDATKVLEFTWPGRTAGRQLTQVGRIELAAAASAISLTSVEFPQASLPGFNLVQIILVPVDKNTKLETPK